MNRRDERRPPPATVYAIVDTLLPAYPALVEQTRGEVAADVTAYVARQIDAMPSFLGFPYRLALRAFAWLPVLRFGRTFAALPAPSRSACLALWTDSPLAPMRDFVKLIRSSALLVFFDHPMVRERLEAECLASGQDGDD